MCPQHGQQHQPPTCGVSPPPPPARADPLLTRRHRCRHWARAWRRWGVAPPLAAAHTTPPTSGCGQARRAFAGDRDSVASTHLVEILKDAKVHYHKRMHEIYIVLEGEGYMELDGEKVPVRPMSSVLIKPGCRHRAVGDLKIINVPIPAFDPEDEWFD